MLSAKTRSPMLPVRPVWTVLEFFSGIAKGPLDSPVWMLAVLLMPSTPGTLLMVTRKVRFGTTMTLLLVAEGQVVEPLVALMPN